MSPSGSSAQCRQALRPWISQMRRLCLLADAPLQYPAAKWPPSGATPTATCSPAAVTGLRQTAAEQGQMEAQPPGVAQIAQKANSGSAKGYAQTQDLNSPVLAVTYLAGAIFWDSQKQSIALSRFDFYLALAWQQNQAIRSI